MYCIILLLLTRWMILGSPPYPNVHRLARTVDDESKCHEKVIHSFLPMYTVSSLVSSSRLVLAFGSIDLIQAVVELI
jgi:hypothetical protein